MIRYLHTMVRIKNVEESLHFYCNILGLKEVRRWESAEERFTNIFLAAPGDVGVSDVHVPHIELTYNWPDEQGNIEVYSRGRNFGHVAFEVDDIYETCTYLQEQGVVIHRPPRDGKMAFISSPDGIAVELLQKGGARDLKEPWVSMSNQGIW
jgi:lactoylglutathione lyase